MNEKRQHVRTEISFTAEISHPASGTFTLLTRDVSDGGMFLIVEKSPLLAVGDIVDVRVTGIVDDPPVCKMQVIRIEDDGIGLMICKPGN